MHTLLVAGLIVSASAERKDAIVVAIIVAAKVGWEQFGGPLPGSVASSGGAVIVDAHLYGAAAGVLAGILAISVLVSVIPAWRAYRNSLADGLTVRI